MVVLQMVDRQTASQVPEQIDKVGIAFHIAVILRSSKLMSPDLHDLVQSMIEPDVERRFDID